MVFPIMAPTGKWPGNIAKADNPKVALSCQGRREKKIPTPWSKKSCVDELKFDEKIGPMYNLYTTFKLGQLMKYSTF